MIMEKLCNSDFERAVLGGMIKYKGIIEEYEGEFISFLIPIR